MASDNRFCDQCGEEIPRTSSRFCPECGAAIPPRLSEEDPIPNDPSITPPPQTLVPPTTGPSESSLPKKIFFIVGKVILGYVSFMLGFLGVGFGIGAWYFFRKKEKILGGVFAGLGLLNIILGTVGVVYQPAVVSYFIQSVTTQQGGTSQSVSSSSAVRREQLAEEDRQVERLVQQWQETLFPTSTPAPAPTPVGTTDILISDLRIQPCKTIVEYDHPVYGVTREQLYAEVTAKITNNTSREFGYIMVVLIPYHSSTMRAGSDTETINASSIRPGESLIAEGDAKCKEKIKFFEVDEVIGDWTELTYKASGPALKK